MILENDLDESQDIDQSRSMQQPLRQKSYAFALSTIQLHQELIERKEYTLGKQFFRSGTSVGANVEEALQTQSKKDFVSKLSISLKEAVESDYWLRLLMDAQILDRNHGDTLRSSLEEIIKMLVSSIRTAKKTIEE